MIGQRGNVLRFAARLQVAVVISEAQHGVVVTDVNVLGGGARRIERNAIRLFQSYGKHRRLLRLSRGGGGAKDPEIAAVSLGDEEIAVRSSDDVSRLLHEGRVQLHLETGRRLRPCVFWTIHDTRPIERGFCRIGLRQVMRRDLVHCPWLLVTKVRKRGSRRRGGGRILAARNPEQTEHSGEYR